MTGCVHIYCGDGKGKTTAAVGQAVRGAGRGRRALIARFLKTDDSGEVLALGQIPEITILPCEKTFGFYYQMTEEQKQEAEVYYTNLLEHCQILAVKKNYDMVILDEILAAVHYKLVDEEQLICFIQKRPKQLELILTGRDPSQALIGLADYVSEIKMLKHPYNTKKLAAREGIEF